MIKQMSQGLLLVYLVIVIISFVFGLRINLSSSMPIGIYQLTSQSTIKSGDIVSICLPHSIAHHGLIMGYIRRGNCAGTKTIPVVKTVIATPGDYVLTTPRGISVNTKFFMAPKKRVDRQGKPVISWSDKFNNVTNQYWFYGEHDWLNSWDSRYLGGIPKRFIQGVYQPIWVF